MPETQTLWTMFQDAALGLFLVVALALLNYLTVAIRQRFLNEAELKKVDALEKAAYAAVRAAEQKVDKASDIVTDLLGEEPTNVNEAADYLIKYNELYKKYKKLTNEEKRSMVMDFLQEKFPDLPVKELEIHLEKAYKEYKDGYYY